MLRAARAPGALGGALSGLRRYRGRGHPRRAATTRPAHPPYERPAPGLNPAARRCAVLASGNTAPARGITGVGWARSRPAGGRRRRAATGSVPRMVRPLGLPFDPIERAGQTWEERFGPACGDARGDVGVPGAADPAGPLRRGAAAARADLRAVRGAGAAHLQPHRRAAAEGHRQPADGAPDLRHQRHRPARRGRLRRPAAQPGRRARRARRHHPGRPRRGRARRRGP